jgi:hypothetical protein
MRLELGKPCKNCPFSVAETRIRFSCRERAEEIEEHAYRNGFPCHLSATLDDEDEDAGYEFGPNTQHCAGAALMFLNEGYETWPGIDNRDLPEGWLNRLLPNLDAAFACAEDFFEANASAGEARRAETTKIGSVHEHATAEGGDAHTEGDR